MWRISLESRLLLGKWTATAWLRPCESFVLETKQSYLLIASQYYVRILCLLHNAIPLFIELYFHCHIIFMMFCWLKQINHFTTWCVIVNNILDSASVTWGRYETYSLIWPLVNKRSSYKLSLFSLCCWPALAALLLSSPLWLLQCGLLKADPVNRSHKTERVLCHVAQQQHMAKKYCWTFRSDYWIVGLPHH